MNKPRKFLVAGTALFILAQCVPVNRSQPPVGAEPVMPMEVRAILQRSCYDCHSNRTRWPWYSRVAPLSWFIAGHVNEGREHLNFTQWDQIGAKDQAEAMEEVAEVVSEGEMPLPSYVLGHPEAALSEADQTLLRQWASGFVGGDFSGNDRDDR